MSANSTTAILSASPCPTPTCACPGTASTKRPTNSSPSIAVASACPQRREDAEADPDHAQFPHLKYPLFSAEPSHTREVGWGDLRIDGFIGGKQVISRTFSGSGVNRKFALLADDRMLVADGADTTRVVLRVTDEFDSIRPFTNDPIRFELTGPAELIGDNPFALVGGTGAVWVRAAEQPGKVRLTAHHPSLGAQHVELEVTGAPQQAS